MDTATNSIVIARHPIFDTQLNVIAYELLFRHTQSATESGIDAFNGDRATSLVINHTFMELGIERVVGDKPAFINLTRTFLTGAMPIPFDNSQVVLEVLEDITVDDVVIHAVETLVERGYRIALDDFIFHESLQPLIRLCHIIKVDILALSKTELIACVAQLQDASVDLLAEKVETREQYQLCRQLGFKYFQGYFFCKPSIISDRPIPNNQLSLLRILAEMQKSDLDFDALEEVISHDVSLTYKLLRFINSAAMGLPRKVESLREALVFLGLATIKKWATLIVLSGVTTKNSELLTLALVRAKMSEVLADDFDCHPKSAFLVGLLSTLDALLSKPMSDIVQSLPVATDIHDALVQQSGNLGQLLKFVIHYEQNYNLDLPTSLPANKVNDAYLQATQWVIQVQNTL